MDRCVDDSVAEALPQLADGLLAGFMTHMCVNTTARGAFSFGYRPTVVAFATATRSLLGPSGVVPAATVQDVSLAPIADLFGVVVPPEPRSLVGGTADVIVHVLSPALGEDRLPSSSVEACAYVACRPSDTELSSMVCPAGGDSPVCGVCMSVARRSARSRVRIHCAPLAA